MSAPTAAEDLIRQCLPALVAVLTVLFVLLATASTARATVFRATTSLATTASADIVLGAGTLWDTATITGRVAPTGASSVTFSLYGPDNATCAGTPLFESVVPVPMSPVSPITVSSGSFTPTLAGTYRWVASYSGDAGNTPAAGVCNAPGESTVVARATPRFATSAAPRITPGITLGSVVLTDTATVSERISPVAGATVTFNLFGPDDAACAAAPIFTSTAQVSGAGFATSDPFTPTAAGTYRWRATYSGDANNAPVTGACDLPEETSVVARATPAIATSASPSITLGVGALTAGATVTGRVYPVAGATVTFALFGPDDPACTGDVVFTSTAPLSEAGTATSAPFTPTAPGTYRWRARYSGDANNSTVAGDCNEPGGSVTVAAAPPPGLPPPPPPPPQPRPAPPPPAGPRILSAAFVSLPRVGSTAVLAVRAVDPRRPVSGLQVDFGESRGLAGISACRVRGLGASRAAVTQRLPYVFRTPGVHAVSITILSGGCTGALRRTTRTIYVAVAPRASARRARQATGERACRDRVLMPTNANRRRIVAATLCLINAERAERGRAELIYSQRLARASSAHSADMLRRKYFEHEAVAGAPQLAARLRAAGYRSPTHAENIGYGSTNPPQLQVRAWMNSPGPRANILHPRLRFVGIGLVIGIPVSPQRPGALYTVDFGAALR